MCRGCVQQRIDAPAYCTHGLTAAPTSPNTDDASTHNAVARRSARAIAYALDGESLDFDLAILYQGLYVDTRYLAQSQRPGRHTERSTE